MLRPLVMNFWAGNVTSCWTVMSSEIMPSTANGLRAALERAATGAERWQTPHYQFRHRAGGTETIHHWAVSVEPLEMIGEHGVLLALSDVQALVNEQNRLAAQVNDLLEQQEREVRGKQALYKQMRSVLAPISGYLQLMARRPQALAEHPNADVLEQHLLPLLRQLLDLVQQASHTSPTE